MELRQVKYKRHEYLSLSRKRQGNLLTLIYDIPYFPACGIFPPLHILNHLFQTGGGDGGMGPGASWQPFSISEEEYLQLKTAVAETPVDQIAPSARFAHVQYQFDDEFDHIEDYLQWYKAVCEKHREQWHKRFSSNV